MLCLAFYTLKTYWSLDFVGKACSVKLTNELCNRIVFSFCADCSCDAVVLEDGQEELNKVWCVGRSDHIQHLDREILHFVVMHKRQPATFSMQWNASVWLCSLEKQYRYLQAIFCSQPYGGSKNKLNIIHLCHYYPLPNKLLINTISKKEVCWGRTFSLVTEGFFVLKMICSFYLCYKISDEGDIRVEFLQTLANVTDHRQNIATT